MIIKIIPFFPGINFAENMNWKYEDNDDMKAPDEPAICPKVAKLSDDMLEFGGEPREVAPYAPPVGALTAPFRPPPRPQRPS